MPRQYLGMPLKPENTVLFEMKKRFIVLFEKEFWSKGILMND